MATRKTTKKRTTKKASTKRRASATKAMNADTRMSVLDAAERVMKEAKKPMRCKDITETMLGKGLWTTNGKTPEATLYAAMLRDIQRNGKKSRFKKVDRGLFANNA